MVNVPASYDQYVKQASAGTGIPYNVVAEQANAESGFQAGVTSSAGAEGWLQFEPGTYDAYAAQAGVKPGTEFNVADETKVYVVYMKALLKQFNGNLRNALAAYNAGPANLSAGYGYADSILSAAKTGNITVGGGGTGAQSDPNASTTSLLGGISVSGLVKSAVNTILGMFGLSDLKDMLERAGLIILGFALIILGIHLLGQMESAKTYVNNQGGSGGEEEAPTRTAGKTEKAVTKEGAGTGASEAVEAAAVA